MSLFLILNANVYRMGDKPSEVKIGFNVPLTGFAAADGKSALNGAEFRTGRVLSSFPLVGISLRASRVHTQVPCCMWFSFSFFVAGESDASESEFESFDFSDFEELERETDSLLGLGLFSFFVFFSCHLSC